MKRTLTRAKSCALTLAAANAFASAGIAAEDGNPSLPASRQLVCCPSDLTAGASLNFIGVHGTPCAPGAVGLVDSTGAGSVTVTLSSKAPSLAIGTVAGTHYLRVKGKSHKITGVSGTSPTWTFAVDGPITGIAGDYAEVIECPTLGKILGANKFGLDEGPFGDPDFDRVFISDNGALKIYKYNPQVGGWATLADVPEDPKLCPNAGIVIQRTAAGAAGVLPISTIKNTDNQSLTICEGLNLYSWPFCKMASLDDLIPAIDAGPFGDPVFDIVFVETNGAIAQYKYNPQVGGWATLADVPVAGSTIKISAGTCFAVQRPAGAGKTCLDIEVSIED